MRKSILAPALFGVSGQTVKGCAVDLFYIVFFTESDIGSGYIAEHYYIKVGPGELRTLRGFVDGGLTDANNGLRHVIDQKDTKRLVINSTVDPPTLSSLLLNATYGGHRLREIAYVVCNRLGTPVEAGLYVLGELKRKETVAL